jgi:hypothetical protein
MRRPKPLPAAAVLFLGVLLEPLGHEIAYDLRYGVARAAVLQAEGAHAYFPAIRSFTTLSLLTGLVLAIIGVLSVRVALGKHSVPMAAGWARPFYLLAAAQVSLFIVQEVLEGFSRGSLDLGLIALLTVFAQLPLAAVSAILLARLQGYLSLAPEAIRRILALLVRRHSRSGLMLPRPAAALQPRRAATRAYTRRGPPRFS